MGYAEGRADPHVSLILKEGRASHTHKGYSLRTTTRCQQPTSTLSIINLQEIGPARCTPAEERMERTEDTASIISLPFALWRSLECVLNDRSVQSAVRESVYSEIHSLRHTPVAQSASFMFYI